MDVHMYPLTLSTTRFKNPIWDLSSSFPGGKRTIYTFRQDDGLSKRSFAFPAHLAVRRGSNLSTIVSERGAKGGEEEDTAYLIPSRSISPNLDQLLIELECLLVNRAAVELRRGDLDVGF